MLIEELTLPSKDLDQQAAFYEDVLGLPVQRALSKTLIQAGETRLQFQQASASWEGYYHFAFEIPNNHFDAAKAWAEKRVTLLKDEEGRDAFDHQSWNARAVYFKDPAGNVLELIARERADTASDRPFTPESIVRVSEFGIAAEDVAGFTGDIRRETGLQVYGSESPGFTAVGDMNGLLIVVSRERIWYPNSGVAADYSPYEAYIKVDGRNFRIIAPSYPGEIMPWAGTVG